MLGAFLDGVAATERIASGLTEEGWACPTPCAEWNAADLLRHLRCAAEDYNAVLDGVLGGRTETVLRGADLAEHNAARLAGLAPGAPLVHLASFGLSARMFAERAAGAWQCAMFQLHERRWIVGGYVGMCALEWHVHAWDLARSAGLSYHPHCWRTLAAAWRESLPHLPLGGDYTWAALLRASGREPAGCESAGCESAGCGAPLRRSTRHKPA